PLLGDANVPIPRIPVTPEIILDIQGRSHVTASAVLYLLFNLRNTFELQILRLPIATNPIERLDIQEMIDEMIENSVISIARFLIGHHGDPEVMIREKNYIGDKPI